jgi:hypothetical protein
MDVDTITSIAVPLTAIVGGWSVGRRGLSRQTVDLLQIQVTALREGNDLKDVELGALKGRVEVLENMVTQRAEVAEVKEIVERIAVKVGA